MALMIQLNWTEICLLTRHITVILYFVWIVFTFHRKWFFEWVHRNLFLNNCWHIIHISADTLIYICIEPYFISILRSTLQQQVYMISCIVFLIKCILPYHCHFIVHVPWFLPVLYDFMYFVRKWRNKRVQSII